jgi:hypothetical protein
LQVSDSFLLVARDAPEANQPAYRRRHTPDNVLTHARGKVSVIAIWIHPDLWARDDLNSGLPMVTAPFDAFPPLC